MKKDRLLKKLADLSKALPMGSLIVSQFSSHYRLELKRLMRWFQLVEASENLLLVTGELEKPPLRSGAHCIGVRVLDPGVGAGEDRRHRQ